MVSWLADLCYYDFMILLERKYPKFILAVHDDTDPYFVNNIIEQSIKLS